MKIRIYQINSERDTDRVMFRDFNSLKGENLDRSIYDLVFDGLVDCKDLEEVYTLFNTQHPIHIPMRSLSVSDVVEVIEGRDIPAGFYYCDWIGFKPVEF